MLCYDSGNDKKSTGQETPEVVLVSAAHCNFVCKVILTDRNLLKTSSKGQGQQHCGDLLLP